MQEAHITHHTTNNNHNSQHIPREWQKEINQPRTGTTTIIKLATSPYYPTLSNKSAINLITSHPTHQPTHYPARILQYQQWKPQAQRHVKSPSKSIDQSIAEFTRQNIEQRRRSFSNTARSKWKSSLTGKHTYVHTKYTYTCTHTTSEPTIGIGWHRIS